MSRAKGEELLQRVCDFINVCRQYRPDVTNEMLCNEGDGEVVYYCNGNDGTNFDWDMNDRTCEFFLFYKSNEMGFVKAFVNRSGVMTGYIYDEDYCYGDEVLKHQARVMSKDEALCFARFMYEVADMNDLYDRPISKMMNNAKVR